MALCRARVRVAFFVKRKFFFSLRRAETRDPLDEQRGKGKHTPTSIFKRKFPWRGQKEVCISRECLFPYSLLRARRRVSWQVSPMELRARISVIAIPDKSVKRTPDVYSFDSLMRETKRDRERQRNREREIVSATWKLDYSYLYRVSIRLAHLVIAST